MIAKRNPYTHVPGSCVNEPEPEVVDQLDLQSGAYDEGWEDCAEQTIEWLRERARIYDSLNRAEARGVLLNAADALKEAMA